MYAHRSLNAGAAWTRTLLTCERALVCAAYVKQKEAERKRKEEELRRKTEKAAGDTGSAPGWLPKGWKW